MHFQGVIFDMDGTLTKPVIDFQAMRRELGIFGGDLIEEVEKLPSPEQQAAWSVINRHEEAALLQLELQEGAKELLAKCEEAGIRLGLVTRNLARSVDFLLGKYGVKFDAVVTRDFPFRKPHPGPVLHILAQWKTAPPDALVVGDYLHDIECGKAAGARTCFFQNPGSPFWGRDADFTVSSMRELAALILG